MYRPPNLTVAAVSDRHADWQYLLQMFCGARPPDLSLRGGRRPTWQSRSSMPDNRVLPAKTQPFRQGVEDAAPYNGACGRRSCHQTYSLQGGH